MAQPIEPDGTDENAIADSAVEDQSGGTLLPGQSNRHSVTGRDCVFEFDPLEDRRWDDFVERHPRSSVFHRKEWLRALKWAYDYEPTAVSSCPPGTPLTDALVFCIVKSRWRGNRLVSLPFSDHCEVLTNSMKDAESLVKHLRKVADAKLWKYVEVRPLSSCSVTETLLPVYRSYFFHKLDLRPSEKEVFAGLHKDCVQRKIRRAGRESITCDQGTSEKLLKQFYFLLRLTRRRQGLPPQPWKWFCALAGSFGDQLKIRVASKDGIPVAAILTLFHRKTVTYKYACSDARFHRLGGPSLLLWEAISEAKAEGFEELDMGRSDIDDAGLVAFKERWGAAPSELTYFRYPAAANRPVLEWSKRAAMRISVFAPSKALTVAGNLLYRHMG
jgi:hypothetical protein